MILLITFICLICSIIIQAQYQFIKRCWEGEEITKKNYLANLGFVTSRHLSQSKPKPKLENWKILLEDLIDRRADFSLQFENLSVHSGLPRKKEQIEMIILYIGGSWKGLLPESQMANNFFNKRGFVSTTIMSIRAAKALKIPNVSIVGFNLPNRVGNLNCGQKDDLFILNSVYEQIHSTYRRARIVVMADCLGAVRLCNWLFYYKVKPTAIILESPIASLQDWTGSFLYFLLCLVLPNYSHFHKGKYSFIPSVEVSNIPILIGTLKHDLVALPHNRSIIAQHFKSVREVVINDKTLEHGQLILSSEFQNAVREFINKIAVV